MIVLCIYVCTATNYNYRKQKKQKNILLTDLKKKVETDVYDKNEEE